MKQPLISVIVPVYNGERYLRECFDSILAQSLKDLELLIVDDGSSDGSGAICDEYASDCRVSVIHKINEGQSIARNTALAIAKGMYVSFIDCDDWLEPMMYETMINEMTASHADIAICGYMEEYVGYGKTVNGDGATTVYSGHEALKMVLQDKIGSYLWTMLFKRSLLQEPMMSLRRYEDHATVFKWFSHAEKVVTIHKVLYHYRQLNGSWLHSFDDHSNDFFTAIRERYYYTEEHQLLPDWSAQNRRLYLRGCMKVTKDLVRMPSFTPNMQSAVCQVRDEIRKFLPISRKEIGTKYYLRMKLLLLSPTLYRCVLRASSLLSLKARKHGHDSLFD